MKKLGASGVFWAVGIFAVVVIIAVLAYNRQNPIVQFSESNPCCVVKGEYKDKVGLGYLRYDTYCDGRTENFNQPGTEDKPSKAGCTTDVILPDGGIGQVCDWKCTENTVDKERARLGTIERNKNKKPEPIITTPAKKKPRRADDTIRE